jgi:deoxyhypusine synthase
LLSSYLHTGFQATSLGLAINEINRMRAWRLSQVPVAADEDDEFKDPAVRANTK